MTDAASLLTPWTNFYLTAGSAAAGLTGLMFVVITLVKRILQRSDGVTGVAAFSTPTVLHFGSALLVSLVMSAPWHSLVSPAIALGLAGLYGIVYGFRAAYLQKRLTLYRPDPEDWTWYTVLPLVSYALILAGAVFLTIATPRALYAIAGGAVFLIFIGIRNAWDVVTYIATTSDDDLTE